MMLFFGALCLLSVVQSAFLSQAHREKNPSSNPLPSKWISAPSTGFSVLHTNKKHAANNVNMIVQNTYKDRTTEFNKKRLAKKLKKKK